MKKTSLPITLKAIILFTGFIVTHCVSYGQTWTAKKSLPFGGSGTFGAAGFALNGKVYFAGGNISKFFIEYDPASDQWTQKANLPQTTTLWSRGTAFSINGKGYVCLGTDGTNFFNSLWQYDLATNQWQAKKPFPGAARVDISSFVINGKAYVVGGLDETQDLFQDEVWEYDPATDQWTKKQSYPATSTTKGIINAFAFAIGNKGYLSCGSDYTGPTSKTYMYDPALDKWTPKAAFTGQPREGGAAFTINNIAWCGLGGKNPVIAYKDFYKYDATTDSWSAAGNFGGNGRAYVATASAGNKAYTGTGWDMTSSSPSAFYSDWWEFNAGTSGISDVQDANTLRFYPNPATDHISFDLPNVANGNYSYKIYSLSGQLITGGILLTAGLNTSNLEAGQYIIEVYSHDVVQRSLVTIQ